MGESDAGPYEILKSAATPVTQENPTTAKAVEYLLASTVRHFTKDEVGS
jgi:hypothetical protein